MGESIVEGTLTRWLKKPGEKVERDERGGRSHAVGRASAGPARGGALHQTAAAGAGAGCGAARSARLACSMHSTATAATAHAAAATAMVVVGGRVDAAAAALDLPGGARQRAAPEAGVGERVRRVDHRQVECFRCRSASDDMDDRPY